jgi:hypothetical protein
MPGEGPPQWMLEMARTLILEELPTGVIVGSAVIEKVTRSTSSGQAPAGGPSTSSGQALFEWHLADVERIKRPRKPARMPQAVWFKPF